VTTPVGAADKIMVKSAAAITDRWRRKGTDNAARHKAMDAAPEATESTISSRKRAKPRPGITPRVDKCAGGDRGLAAHYLDNNANNDRHDGRRAGHRSKASGEKAFLFEAVI